jgi:hypothetical protein
MEEGEDLSFVNIQKLKIQFGLCIQMGSKRFFSRRYFIIQEGTSNNLALIMYPCDQLVRNVNDDGKISFNLLHIDIK